MTAKDYRIIAAAILAARVENPSAGGAVFDDVARKVAAALKDINPRFDTSRFLAACGVPDNQ
jgi:hypothetical protein